MIFLYRYIKVCLSDLIGGDCMIINILNPANYLTPVYT